MGSAHLEDARRPLLAHRNLAAGEDSAGQTGDRSILTMLHRRSELGLGVGGRAKLAGRLEQAGWPTGGGGAAGGAGGAKQAEHARQAGAARRSRRGGRPAGRSRRGGKPEHARVGCLWEEKKIEMSMTSRAHWAVEYIESSVRRGCWISTNFC